MNTQKQILRQKMQAARYAMSYAEANKKSQLICRRVIESVDWSEVNSLHIYSLLFTKKEVDTTVIQDTVAQRWPHITVTSPLPAKDQPFPNEKFDLIIVPVLSFDKEKYRLGYGGGWYDRLLFQQKQALAIGLAYSFAEINNLPHEPHDIALHQIMTEVAIID